MLLLILAALIILRFSNSPLMLGTMSAFLILATAGFLFLRNGDVTYLTAMGASTLFFLFLSILTIRVKDRIDHFRKLRG